MNKLPDGYTPLEYLEIKTPRMFLLNGFNSKTSAEKRIQDLQKDFPSPLYQCGVIPQNNILDYIILLPENAISFLKEEEKQKLLLIKREAPSRIRLRENIDSNMILYRFMEEEYIDKFFETGELLISTYNRCKKLEDENRKDDEGHATLIGNQSPFKCVMDIGVGNNALLLCTSTTSEYNPPDGKVEEYAIEIHNVLQFFELVTKQLTKEGFVIMNALNGHCIYSGRTIDKELQQNSIEKILSESNKSNTFDFGLFHSIFAEMTDDQIYFMKPPENTYENEYRFLWLLEDDVKEEKYIIHLPIEARKLCRKIKLKD